MLPEQANRLSFTDTDPERPYLHGQNPWRDQYFDICRYISGRVEREYGRAGVYHLCQYPHTLTGDAWRAAWATKLAASASAG